jgi:hypothetical protein
MALNDWKKLNDMAYETKELPRGRLTVIPIKGGYVVYHKPASVGSHEEPLTNKIYLNKTDAIKVMMNRVKKYSY